MPTQNEVFIDPASIGALSNSPAAESASDRRKSRRFPCEGEAKVTVLGGALSFTGKLNDLSINGCCMRTEVAFTLERGTQVEVLMAVNNASFRVAAGVRSNHKVHGVGLEFINVSNRSARLIQDLTIELELLQKRQAANQA